MNPINAAVHALISGSVPLSIPNAEKLSFPDRGITTLLTVWNARFRKRAILKS